MVAKNKAQNLLFPTINVVPVCVLVYMNTCMYVFVCVHASVWEYVCVCLCVCPWRPAVDPGCLLPPFILCFETGFLAELWAHQSPRLAVNKPWGSSCLYLANPGIIIWVAIPGFYSPEMPGQNVLELEWRSILLAKPSPQQHPLATSNFMTSKCQILLTKI